MRSTRLRRLRNGFALALMLAAVTAAPATPSPGWRPAFIPAGFSLAATGPDGGTVWVGRIPNSIVLWDHRDSAIYLPPGVDSDQRYPVIYLLHGMSGSPSSLYLGMRLPEAADRMIASGGIAPFIGVMPVAGPTKNRNSGEWAGVWENYVVDDVVPWVDQHLPADPHRDARAIAGLSAGGYGAIDIGLRHPRLFSQLQAWSGYFEPLRDGPFLYASPRFLASHTPTALVRDEAPLLRDLGTRFYLSTGPSHGAVSATATVAFARELLALNLSCRLWILPPTSRAVWRPQLPPALEAAFGRGVLSQDCRDATTALPPGYSR